jgi:hypothetical protein
MDSSKDISSKLEAEEESTMSESVKKQQMMELRLHRPSSPLIPGKKSTVIRSASKQNLFRPSSPVARPSSPVPSARPEAPSPKVRRNLGATIIRTKSKETLSFTDFLPFQKIDVKKLFPQLAYLGENPDFNKFVSALDANKGIAYNQEQTYLIQVKCKEAKYYSKEELKTILGISEPPFEIVTFIRDSKCVHYAICLWLGSGTFGEVYLLQDLKTGELTAMKALPIIKDEKENAERVKAIQTTKEMINKYQYNFGQYEPLIFDDKYHFLMPFVPGYPVKKYFDPEILKTKVMSDRGNTYLKDLSYKDLLESVEIACEFLSEIVNNYFNKGILHGDINSGNVYVAELDGTYKCTLIDPDGITEMQEASAKDEPVRRLGQKSSSATKLFTHQVRVRDAFIPSDFSESYAVSLFIGGLFHLVSAKVVANSLFSNTTARMIKKELVGLDKLKSDIVLENILEKIYQACENLFNSLDVRKARDEFQEIRETLRNTVGSTLHKSYTMSP